MGDTYRDTVEPVLLKVMTSTAREIVDELTTEEAMVLIVLVRQGMAEGFFTIGDLNEV